MVVFTCGHCGESLQKPKVEKHYDTKCRNKYPDLSCMDCLKDFRGDEFRAHTKCVSEAERYGGKGFVARPGQNKGEKKQNAWIEIVQSVLDENANLSGKLRNLLERVAQQPNTPRKKPKFVNFMKSMDHRITMGDMESAWDLLSAKLDLLKTVPQVSTSNIPSVNDANAEKKDDETPMEVDQDTPTPEKKKKNKKNKENEVTSNGHEEANEDEVNNTIKDKTEEVTLSKKERKEKKKKEKYEAQLKAVASENNHVAEDGEEVQRKGKKRKFDTANEDDASKTNGVSMETSEEVANANGVSKKKKSKDSVIEFDWTKTILSVIESKKKDIALKKLQKRVLTEYCVVYGVSEITDRISKKFTKSLYKIQNLKIENDKVRLVTEEE